MKPKLIVEAAKDDPRMRKCPRCWRWHGIVTNTPWQGEREVFCDRCEAVLLNDHKSHEAAIAIHNHRSAGLDPYRTS